MKKFVTYLLAGGALFAACSKREQKPVTPEPPVTDARTILLQTVLEKGLPPQYRFTYDRNNFVTSINYADGFSIYNVEYENKRVKKLVNSRNNNYLLYHYQNNSIDKIDEFDPLHNKLETYALLYNNTGKLVELDRFNCRENPNGALYKKEKLFYHPDGNLARLEQYFLSEGTLKLLMTKEYNGYDNSINVDDFYKLHGFLESFLYLPQVKLQINNPKKEIIITEQNSFEINNTFEFSGNLPVKKMGDMIQTRGGNGQPHMARIMNQYIYN